MFNLRHSVLLLLLISFVAENAWSHAVLLSSSRNNDPNFNSPTPRSDADDLKPPFNPLPCGGVAASANPKVYNKGQKIKFEWGETVQHPGVYIFELTTNGGQTFTKLGDFPDNQNGGGVNRNNPNTWHYYQHELSLPANVTCDANCFIRFRQQMTVSTVDDNNLADGNDYISCADIKIVDTKPDPDPNPMPDPTPDPQPTPDPGQTNQSSNSATQEQLPSLTTCGSIGNGPKGPNTTAYLIVVMSLFFLPLMLTQTLRPSRQRRFRK